MHISYRGAAVAPFAVTNSPLLELFGGSNGFLYECPRFRLFEDASAADPVTADLDLIYRVNDLSGGGNNGLQATAGSRPRFLGKRPQASLAPPKLGFFNVPDVTGGTVGEGATCTGLDFDGTDFWVVSEGRADSLDVSYLPLLVRVDVDGVKQEEIDLKALDATVTSAQGFCIDDTDGTFWVAFPNEGKILHVDTDGSLIGTLTGFAGANGLTYDSTRDRLWVMTTTTLSRITKAGSVEFSRTFIVGMVNGYDHIAYDATHDLIWMLGDVTGSTTGAMFPYSITGNYFGSPLVIFTDVTAIEGLVFVGSVAYVAHDGYFHTSTATIKKNQVQWYDLSGLDAAIAPLFSPSGIRFGGWSGLNLGLSSGFNPTAAMTMMFSGYLEDAGGLTQAVMGSDSATANTRAMFGINANGRLCAGVGAQNFAAIVEPSGDRRRGPLTAFLRWDGTTVKMDVAGEGRVFEGPQSGSPNTTRPIAFGAYNNNSSSLANGVNGLLHMGAAIDRAVSDAELAQVADYAIQLWH